MRNSLARRGDILTPQQASAARALWRIRRHILRLRHENDHSCRQQGTQEENFRHDCLLAHLIECGRCWEVATLLLVRLLSLRWLAAWASINRLDCAFFR